MKQRLVWMTLQARCGSRLGFVDVKDHLRLFVLETTLFVECCASVAARAKRRLTDIGLAAIEDDLVAPCRATNLLKSVDEVQTESTSLGSLGHSNILNVSDNSASTCELALDKDCSHSHKLRVSRAHIRTVGAYSPCPTSCRQRQQ